MSELPYYFKEKPAQCGYKFGPVFAAGVDIAERLIQSLLAKSPGQQVQLDVPEPNEAGVRLALNFGLSVSRAPSNLPSIEYSA